MSEYTFETAALKAVTIDAVKYNEEGLRNSITPETIQAVVPIAWGDSGTANSPFVGSLAIGAGASTKIQYGTAIGVGAEASIISVSLGTRAKALGSAVAIGYEAVSQSNCVSLGLVARTSKSCGVTIGAQFTETVDGQNVTNYCTTEGTGSITIGAGANTLNNGDIESSNSVTIGCKANTTAPDSITLGAGASNTNSGSILIGSAAKSEGDKALTITIGSQFTETTDAGDITHPCSTEGTGSITIGAGANTLNNGSTESSNSVTIGCKASNSGADSVVIGAQAKGWVAGSVFIGASATSRDGDIHPNTALGSNAKASWNSVSVGQHSSAHMHSITVGKQSHAAGYSVVIGNNSLNDNSQYAVVVGNNSTANTRAIALGYAAKANAIHSMAIGEQATVADYGAIVIRSIAEDGIYTQLYFSGANTPLANTYEGGEAMMGYVVRDSAGNIMMDAEGNALVGTQKLSVLFPNNRGENAFAPVALNLDEGWTPKPMFRPSDLDLPIEEPEVEEPENIEPAKPLVYKPQPVYPIVEPEIEGINNN